MLREDRGVGMVGGRASLGCHTRPARRLTRVFCTGTVSRERFAVRRPRCL